MVKKVNEARMRLEKLGIFSSVGIFIDTSKGRIIFPSLNCLLIFFSKTSDRDLIGTYVCTAYTPSLFQDPIRRKTDTMLHSKWRNWTILLVVLTHMYRQTMLVWWVQNLHYWNNDGPMRLRAAGFPNLFGPTLVLCARAQRPDEFLITALEIWTTQRRIINTPVRESPHISSDLVRLISRWRVDAYKKTSDTYGSALSLWAIIFDWNEQQFCLQKLERQVIELRF